MTTANAHGRARRGAGEARLRAISSRIGARPFRDLLDFRAELRYADFGGRSKNRLRPGRFDVFGPATRGADEFRRAMRLEAARLTRDSGA